MSQLDVLEGIEDLGEELAKATSLLGKDFGETKVESSEDQPITLYNRMTGVANQVHRSMLRFQLLRTFPPGTTGPDGKDWGGTLVYTNNLEKCPTPVKGTYKCFLHPLSEHRPLVNQLGMGQYVCPAASLASPLDVDHHAKTVHKREWARFEQHRLESLNSEDRGRQQKQLDAMLALAGRNASQESVEPHSASETTIPGAYYCEAGCGRFWDNELAMKQHMGRDHKDGA